MANIDVIEAAASDSESRQLNQLAVQVAEEFQRECAHSGGWISIVPGFRTPNGERTDNDIVIFGALNNFLLTTKGPEPNKCFQISNFVAVVECKGHSRLNHNLKLQANDILVSYNDKRLGYQNFSSTFKQAEECARSVKSEISQRLHISPYIEAFVWLYNFSQEPRLPYSFGSAFSARDFFGDIMNSALIPKLAAKKCLFDRPDRIIFQATGNSRAPFNSDKLKQYVGKLAPTSLRDNMAGLTRQRVERITRNRVNNSQFYGLIGHQTVEFIGGPGTGKTASLLYCAKWLVTDERKRVLLLTYNHVLRCDLKRLMEYAGLNSVEEFGMHPKSSIQFFTELIIAFDLAKKGHITKDFLDNRYEECLSVVVDLIREFNNSSGSNRSLPQAALLLTNYDLVMIDEGQDWPLIERDCIIALWNSSKIVVAKSSDQMVRGGLRPTDWCFSGPYRQVPRKKCLRQGKTLVGFNTILMNKMSYSPASYEEDPEMGGGQVLLVEGPYTVQIHQKIYQKYALSNQEKYDTCLACHTGLVLGRAFYLRKEFERHGFGIWDACNEETRRFYPIGDDKHRAMFYESCRGIEAWSFVCLEFDVWLENTVYPKCETEYDMEIKQLTLLEQSAMNERDKEIKNNAAKWALIPLTRAIAYTIINVRSFSSAYGKICLEAVREMPDESYEIIEA